MRTIFVRALCFTVPAFFIFSIQGCGPASHRTFESASGTLSSADQLPVGYSLSVDSNLQAQAIPILSNRCGACHQDVASGGISHILDVNHLVISGLIVPGDITQGRLLATISTGTMPKNSSLPATELQTLQAWVASMRLNGAIPLPADPIPAGMIAQADPILHEKAIQILNVNCAGCHQGMSNGGLGNILDLSGLIRGGWIKAGDASQGRLLGAISDGTMPKGGGARVSTADIQSLRQWIQSVQIVTDSGQSPMPGRAALSPTFTGVYANIIQPKCIACHGPIKQVDKRFDSYSSVKSNAAKILSESQTGGMPRSPYPRVTAAELTALRAWIDAGALNN